MGRSTNKAICDEHAAIARKALEQAKQVCGSGAALAREIEISPHAVYQWVIVPPLRVLPVERATRGQVSRHRLRPDLYP